VRFNLPTSERDSKGRKKYKPYERSIGERGKITKAQAMLIHDRIKVKIKGGLAAELLIESPTLHEFLPQFIQHKKEVEQIRSSERYVYSGQQLERFFGGYTKLSEITPKRVDEYKARRLKTVKPGTVNRELQCLRAMINLAKTWNQFQGENPVSKAGLLDEIRDDLVPLTWEEEDKLIAVLSPSLARIVEFDLNTGMRIDEVITLREKAVDFGRRIAKLEATEQKGKRTREVPLNERALDLIHEAIDHGKRYRNPQGYIFLNWRQGKPYQGHDAVYPSIIRACKRAGIRRIHPHLLRHTFITRAIEAGAGPISVQEIVGHANLKTLLRYVHLKESKYRAVDAIMRKKGTEHVA